MSGVLRAGVYVVRADEAVPAAPAATGASGGRAPVPRRGGAIPRGGGGTRAPPAARMCAYGCGVSSASPTAAAVCPNNRAHYYLKAGPRGHVVVACGNCGIPAGEDAGAGCEAAPHLYVGITPQ